LIETGSFSAFLREKAIKTRSFSHLPFRGCITPGVGAGVEAPAEKPFLSVA